MGIYKWLVDIGQNNDNDDINKWHNMSDFLSLGNLCKGGKEIVRITESISHKYHINWTKQNNQEFKFASQSKQMVDGGERTV